MYDYRLTVTQNARCVMDTATPGAEWLQARDQKALVGAVAGLMGALGEAEAPAKALALARRALARRSYGAPDPAVCVVLGYGVGLIVAPQHTPYRLAGIRVGFRLWATTLLGKETPRRSIAEDADGYPYGVSGLDEALLTAAHWAVGEVYGSAKQQALRCTITTGLSAEDLARKAAVLRVQMSRRKTRGMPGLGYSDIPFSAELCGADDAPWAEKYLVHVEIIARGAKGYGDLPSAKEGGLT